MMMMMMIMIMIIIIFFIQETPGTLCGFTEVLS